MAEHNSDESQSAASAEAGAEAVKPEAVKPASVKPVKPEAGRRSEGAVLDEMQAHKRRLRRLEEELGLGDLDLTDDAGVKPLKPEGFKGGAEAVLDDDLLAGLLF